MVHKKRLGEDSPRNKSPVDSVTPDPASDSSSTEEDSDGYTSEADADRTIIESFKVSCLCSITQSKHWISI